MTTLPSFDFDHGETIDMLRETVRQLNDLRGAVGERFGEELADVFTTHIIVLEDQGFRAKLRRGVERHGNGARALIDQALKDS